MTYPEVLVARQLDAGSAGESSTLVGPWSGNGRCSGDGDFVVGDEAIVCFGVCAVDDRGIVDIALTETTAGANARYSFHQWR